ncbi:MAG: ABC transporter ATP-binding protein [Bacillota bacterium]
MTENFLEITSLGADYGENNTKTQVLNNVSLNLAKSKIGVLIGPSGCGKSTLLNIIAGLKKEFQGTVLIDGKAPAYYPHTALILQDYGLLPWKTVWENVILGLKIKKMPQAIIADKAKQILDQLGLYKLASRYPSQLSGGQRQRIAIARSLVLEPQLLLMDEPFSSLDALTREEMQQLLLEIWQKTKLTILLVTHNIEEAVYLGQDIFLMTALPGAVKEKLCNKIASGKGARETAEFLELVNYIRSSLHEVQNDGF